MKVCIGPYKDNDSKRKEEVHIHDYDTWSMDHTLALIALPMLKQLKETKHGVPYIDYEDMPEHLQYIQRAYDPRAIYDMIDQSQQPEWDDLNEMEFQRQIKCWDWMMDEMIWAMDQIANEDKVDPDTWYSKEFNDRMSNALKLFGKYYRSLWD